MAESTTTRRLSDQDQAVLLLTQARDLLAQRLTNAILHLGDDLLEDARGESFAGEIDTLHDQIGTRLSQVNVMLAGLSAQDDVEDQGTRRSTSRLGAQPSSPPGRDIPDATWIDENTQSQRTEATEEAAPVTFPPSTYPLFVQDIVRRDLVAAGRRLAEVLGTTQNQAEIYATRFRDQLDRDPAFLAKVHRLRKALQTEDHNQARWLLRECFELQGLESQAAMPLLKIWL